MPECETHSVPALLLAAGLGTRLMPLTASIPKCLVPINKKPLLGYWLDALGHAGLTPLIVNTCHHADQVEAFLAKNIWHERIILAPERDLLGTGGTVLANRKHLEGGAFMVLHADNLSRFCVENFLATHAGRPSNCVMTMMLFRSPTPQTCGIVELDDKQRVIHFHEKVPNPPGNLANGAVYVMESAVLGILDDIRREKEKPDLSLDVIPRCMGRIFTWVNDDYHRDIGTIESYKQALRDFS